MKKILSILFALATFLNAPGKGFAAGIGSIGAIIETGVNIGWCRYNLSFGELCLLDLESASVSLSMIPDDNKVLVSYTGNVKTLGAKPSPMYGFFLAISLPETTSYHVYINDSTFLSKVGGEESATPLKVKDFSIWIYDGNEKRWKARSSFMPSDEKTSARIVVLATLDIPAGTKLGVYRGTYDIFLGPEN